MISPLDTNKYKITASYNDYNQDLWGATGGYHHAVDIAAPAGTPFVASGNGTVVFSGWNNDGQGIKVEHQNGLTSVYWHNLENLVNVGDRVSEGQVIGKVGQTGHATGPHVHWAFESYDPYRLFDPMQVVKESQEAETISPDMMVVQPGWGISYIAQAAGYEDFGSEARWDYLAKLNGHASHNDWFLHPGDLVYFRGNIPEKPISTAQSEASVAPVVDTNIVSEIKPATEPIEAPKQQIEINTPNNLKTMTQTVGTDQKFQVDFSNSIQLSELKPLKVKFIEYWDKLPGYVKYSLPVLVSWATAIAITFTTMYVTKDLTVTTSAGVVSLLTKDQMQSWIIGALKYLQSEADKYYRSNVGTF